MRVGRPCVVRGRKSLKSRSGRRRNTTLQRLYELELHKINRLLLLFSVFEFYFQPFPCLFIFAMVNCSCNRVVFNWFDYILIFAAAAVAVSAVGGGYVPLSSVLL